MTTLEAWEKERERWYSASTTEAIARERDALRVERDRLREALEKILKCTLPVPMQDIARAALAEGGQDEPT
jgi:hypothetical protein